MQGALNIDKPAGITSHDVIYRIRRILKESSADLPTAVSLPKRGAKVGHAGTLDPFATGVLVVAIGPATRLLEYARDLSKTYRAIFVLGATSDTDDVTGSITNNSAKPPAKQEVASALQEFVGNIQQVPPAYSAIKIKGQKLYDLARSGKPVLAKPRPVTVHDIKLLQYDYPRLELEITCGSGTYIRSLARDLGEKLGTGGYVETLRRIEIGSFSEQGATSIDDLTSKNIGQYLLSPKTLIEHLPKVILPDPHIKDFQQGKSVVLENALFEEGPIAVFESSQNIVGIGQVQAGSLQPEKVLST